MSENNDYYLAESYQNLETVGGIFEKDGKEYINVVLKSGKVHAARVYRSVDRPAAKSKHIIYDLYTELGFYPKQYIYLIRCEDESKLNGICHFNPRFGAYLKCSEDIFDLPIGCKIKKLYWTEICLDDIVHLFSDKEIRKIAESKFLFEK